MTSKPPRPGKGTSRPGFKRAADEFIDSGRRAVARAERVIKKALERDAEIDAPTPRMTGGWE
jgi:hypothetical protein